MHFLDSVISSLQTIMSHKMRSFLTLLGIIIGITAVVAMFSSIYGIKAIMKENMENMGFNNSLYVMQKRENSSSGGRHFGGMMRYNRTSRKSKPVNYRDFEYIKAKAQYKYIYGMVENWQKTSTDEWILLKSTNNDFFKSKSYELSQGRYFNNFEEKNAENVCIIGHLFAEEVLNDTNPIGKLITVGKKQYNVIGVLGADKLNTKAGFSFNPWERRMELRAVYVPLKTGSTYFRNNKTIDFIYLQAEDGESFAKLKTDITQLLLSRRNMSHDFDFEDIGSMFITINQEMDEMLKKWNLTLMAIASVSLIVGGIGLFSTLLISINERMMEIGVRKSLGATDKDIFFYFIMEALVLSFIAAVIGISLGVILVKSMGAAMGSQLVISAWSLIIGLSFAFAIGLLSGIFPAYKASSIDPIQAIYYFE
ncbi:MAG: ABC transporter permease [Candidatus Cloacimonadales bacterium]|jgi:putative ABC transport system permease protein|nr:ABC transporter permease [Candidatus Cloacimonadota bacterium]MDD2649735.1 ABC transporter permease [Candidatus Cloacimonadota bacterium]MDD3501066.1 ABC transporter permease [Candidatus Cloacimonadota bacterium]MDX9978044.1 ABC transporter permease [Candidatus Cloacimonadales bacterium]